MKRARLFCFAIALVLIMTLSAAALAEYTHPSGAYGLTLPEGWFPVTHATADYFQEMGVVNTAIKEEVFAATVGQPVTVLYETGLITDSFFKNNIRINLTDIGSPLSLEYYVTTYGEATEERIMSTFPQAQMIIPLQLAIFGKNQAAVHAFSWTANDGSQYAWMDIVLAFDTRVIQMGVECKLEDASRCGAALEEVAASFFVP